MVIVVQPLKNFLFRAVHYPKALISCGFDKSQNILLRDRVLSNSITTMFLNRFSDIGIPLHEFLQFLARNFRQGPLYLFFIRIGIHSHKSSTSSYIMKNIEISCHLEKNKIYIRKKAP